MRKDNAPRLPLSHRPAIFPMRPCAIGGVSHLKLSRQRKRDTPLGKVSHRRGIRANAGLHLMQDPLKLRMRRDIGGRGGGRKRRAADGGYVLQVSPSAAGKTLKVTRFGVQLEASLPVASMDWAVIALFSAGKFHRPVVAWILYQLIPRQEDWIIHVLTALYRNRLGFLG